jgi:DNA adenine methylase
MSNALTRAATILLVTILTSGLACAIAQSALSPVTATQTTTMDSPMSYIGGKHRLAKTLVALFPPHVTYCEVFLGGGQVFFRKAPSKVEVLNDLDGDVVNFFRCAQQHHDELCRQLKFVLVSREWFQVIDKQNPAALTDIQRAARFFYLQKNAYAGLVHGRHYAAKVVGPPGFNPSSLPAIFDNVHKRLARVQIESLSFEEFIPKFDRPTTLFFCDPPYWQRKLYNFNFTGEQFRLLADLLQSIRGKFVLTVDDVPQLRELFHKSNITEIAIPYTAQREAGKRFRELIITNF